MTKRENELQARIDQLEAQLYTKPVAGQSYDRDDDGYYNPGCGQDDTRDSRGRKLLSKYNEGGEPRGYM